MECVFALKKNWPVTFAVPPDVLLMGNWYGIQKVICFTQLNSTSEGRSPFMTLYLWELVLLDAILPIHPQYTPFGTEMTKSLILYVPMRTKHSKVS